MNASRSRDSRADWKFPYHTRDEGEGSDEGSLRSGKAWQGLQRKLKQTVADFVSEVEVGCSLAHPNLVRAVGVRLRCSAMQTAPVFGLRFAYAVPVLVKKLKRGSIRRGRSGSWGTRRSRRS
jgi:hypothetical protein